MAQVRGRVGWSALESGAWLRYLTSMLALMDWSEVVTAIAGAGVFALALFVLARRGGGT